MQSILGVCKRPFDVYDFAAQLQRWDGIWPFHFGQCKFGVHFARSGSCMVRTMLTTLTSYSRLPSRYTSASPENLVRPHLCRGTLTVWSQMVLKALGDVSCCLLVLQLPYFLSSCTLYSVFKSRCQNQTKEQRKTTAKQ
eukprot:1888147-Amphidinium_carterae.1